MTVVDSLSRVVDGALAGAGPQFSLPMPHLLVGNCLLGRFLIREMACRRLVDHLPNSTEGRQRLIQGHHPDYIEIRITPGKAKIAEARQISVDLAKRQGHKLVIGILGFDHFSSRAQDVLLKTFEETSEWELYVSVPSTAGIAQTIISRCHSWLVPEVSHEDKLVLLAWAGLGNRDLGDKALDLAYGSLDRAWYWLEDDSTHKFLKNWDLGPQEALKKLANFQEEVSKAFLDATWVALKHYLLWSQRVNAISLLMSLPSRTSLNLMVRNYLADIYTLLVARQYGKIVPPALKLDAEDELDSEALGDIRDEVLADGQEEEVEGSD